LGRSWEFKGRQFTAEVILWGVRWHLMFPIGYRNLERGLGCGRAIGRGKSCASRGKSCASRHHATKVAQSPA
jgi:hypothetical protein